MAAHVVDHGSGMFSTGFGGDDAPRAELPTFALSQNGEMCTVDASTAGQFFLENLDNVSMCPCILHIAPGNFLGTLDDEEFFVVEGEGVTGSPGVRLPGDPRPISLRDCCIGITAVDKNTVEHACETTTTTTTTTGDGGAIVSAASTDWFWC